MQSRHTVVAMMIVFLAAFSGCANERAASSPAPRAPQDDPSPAPQDAPSQPQQYPSTGSEAADSPGDRNTPPAIHHDVHGQITPEEERKAIMVAKEYLAKQSGEPVQGEFEARRTEDGYSVFVLYHAAYDEQGRPFVAPGGHCVVLISKDWIVIRVIGGA